MQTYRIILIVVLVLFFFFQAEDGIRDRTVTGVQTCALPILPGLGKRSADGIPAQIPLQRALRPHGVRQDPIALGASDGWRASPRPRGAGQASQIGRAYCRERVEVAVGDGVCKEKTCTAGWRR